MVQPIGGGRTWLRGQTLPDIWRRLSVAQRGRRLPSQVRRRQALSHEASPRRAATDAIGGRQKYGD